MKPIPASRMQREIPSGDRSILTPNAVSTSAAPDFEDSALLPCFAIGTPAAATTIAGNGGDLVRVESGDPNLHDEGFDSFAGNLLVSGILDFFIPLSMLALGIGGELVKELTEKVLKEMLIETGIEILIELGKQIAVDTFSIFAGTFGVDALLDQLKDIGITIGTAIAHAIAKPQLAGIASTG